MEIQNPSSAWLSDYEVFQLLQGSKESRNAGTKLPENILTVEFEVNQLNNYNLIAAYPSETTYLYLYLYLIYSLL